MSRLDDELKNALETPAASPREVHASVATATATPSRSKRRFGLLIGLCLMSSAILLVVFTGIDNAAVYSKSVDQLMVERARFRTRNVRVLGHLVQGSLKRRSEPCEYRFKLTEGHQELEVHYPQCIIPDTFRDLPGIAVEVTAEGRLQADGTFLADRILAKCPSKYDMNEKRKSGQQMPGSAGPSTKLEGSVINAPYASLDTSALHPVLTDR
jgi:cytochrome c-type biogenesis protein CcmE